ncbi:glycoside hydrolase/deacetylase [Microthyrium microscopicum]|uniref:Glycoside hydrolase/deacetylase n=1 Tax=Microthyrium microscopicum TaxID=703497 RepID=A0A6A6UJ58_9PEZI|nr:glycoside hydrolase/deacetylase [Microthyrium microscopicum]
MIWISMLAASLTALPVLTNAHYSENEGLPKLLGSRAVQVLKERLSPGQYASTIGVERSQVWSQHSRLSRRQNNDNIDGECGSGPGACANGYCCSAAGWCGKGIDYCSAPDCQFNYGNGCDTLMVPNGPLTRSVQRTKIGDVPYGGAGVYSCVKPGNIAITFDDGPNSYTSHVLDLFDQYKAKATFFITGNNIGKGPIDNAAYPWASVIKRAYASGHQIASHTWGHQDLSLITKAQRLDQMYHNEVALNNILGFFPTYMRPPYSSCTNACQKDLADLGYHVIYFDLDTEDYLNDDPNKIMTSKIDFFGNMTTKTAAKGGSFLSISHDIHYQTAYNLTEFMLSTFTQLGYKSVTVGECLGDDPANWYRTLGGGSLETSAPTQPPPAAPTAPPTAAPTLAPTSSPVAPPPGTVPQSVVSVDATCGTKSGFTCKGSQFGGCCSVNGWCGSSTAHCGTGCQSGFGTCGITPTGGKGKPVSLDASCGGVNGFTCIGSEFGSCCSPAGYCGSTSAYCSTGCQRSFGQCTK